MRGIVAAMAITGAVLLSWPAWAQAARPSVETGGATEINAQTARLWGTIDPNGLETTYQFEYGPTLEYGSKSPALPQSIGTGPVGVMKEIEGLKAETTYHLRLVATNADGTTAGEDRTFTTASWEILSTPNPAGATASNR